MQYFGQAVCLHKCTACLPEPELIVNDGDVYIIIMVALKNSDRDDAVIRKNRDFLWWQALNMSKYFLFFKYLIKILS